MKKKIIIALSALFLLGTISTAVYAKDSATPQIRTVKKYQTVDPDTEH